MPYVLDLFFDHLKSFWGIKYLVKKMNDRQGERSPHTRKWQLNHWIFLLEMIKFITKSCTSYALKM